MLSGFSMFGLIPILMFIVYGLFLVMGLYVLYLLIKFLLRAIEALDIYLNEKRGRRY